MNDRQAGNQRGLPSAVRGYLSAIWAMEESAHAALMAQLAGISPHDLAGFFDPTEPPPAAPKKPYQIASGVAVLPLTGVLQKRPDWFTVWFPGEATALETWTKQLRRAASDPDVTSIVLKIDSPGGLVDGTSEAAEAVRAVRSSGRKPIVAVSSGLCCSAAYWIGCQASELWAGPTDWIGSIGTRQQLVDSSGFYEGLGVKFDYVTSGSLKAAGAEGVPVTDAVRAYFQSLVDRSQQEFTAGVARGRKMPVDSVRALVKEGRIYIGSDAMAEGLIDGIATVEAVASRLQKSGGGKAGAGARTGGGASMSRLEDFLAWVKGEGGDENPAANVTQKQPDTAALQAQIDALKAEQQERNAALATERKTRIETEAKVFADALPAGLRPAARTNAEKAFTALAMAGSDEGIAALKASFEGVPDKPLTGESVRVFTLPEGGAESSGDREALRAEGKQIAIRTRNGKKG